MLTDISTLRPSSFCNKQVYVETRAEPVSRKKDKTKQTEVHAFELISGNIKQETDKG